MVSKICFFVSASNWTIILGKIKNHIACWSGPEEFPDCSETRLLEFCSLNRHRLSSILRELSAQFTYPNEYAALVRSNGRLKGAPDVLFDVAHGLSENGKKRAYTWPMMAMLLAVCPDIVLKITAAFIDSLRKHLKAVKMTDVATTCCVNLCKAATFSPKTTAEGPGLRLLALDLVGDLNSRLLNPSKPCTNSEGVAKRAKLVMRTIASNSPIIDPLWDKALRRWKLLSSLVGHRPFEDSSGNAGMYDCAPALGAISGEGENTNAWISISGLLTSIASLHDPSHPKPRLPPLNHFIPPDLLHDRFYALPDRARNVDRYIQEMVDLLVADDLRMREGVKDALGTELHTALFPILLKHLKSIVAHFFEHKRAKPQSPFSHFIEQAISMLRLFFERIVEPLAEPVAEILWEVVKQGGHLLPDLVKPVRPSGLDKIVDMITRPDLTLALAICKVCGSADFEEMTEVMLNIFDYRKGVIKFLKASIEREVAVTDHESTVSRGNLFTTRLLTIFARAQGYDYLRNMLSNLLVGLANKPSEFSVDFNPHRASADDDEAARNLEQVTEVFLNVIAVSWKKLPCAIREICHHIATTVQEKYPESLFTSIGGFIFLRFINPTIVSPEVIDLDLPNDTRKIRRSLVMITKVPQALSNNIRFSAREPAMKPLNPFMANNVYPMTRFLKNISSIDEPGMIAEEATELQDKLAPVPLDATDRYVLHLFLYENQEKLGAELKSVRPMEFKHWHDGSEWLTPTPGHEI
ncbi:hypothetical protein PtB15_12B143 [Puccinia triticina]|nr:hypothetical protein PtB15_12B143 [Puccinia triticina]